MNDWPKAILFDFDGVIVNSEPLHFLAFNETLKREGVSLSEQDYYANMLGFDDKGGFKHIFQTRNLPLPPAQFLRMMTRKSEIMRDLIAQRRFSALPGAASFIRALWRHYPLAICSGALREEIETMLDGVALRDCFRVIVAAEDTPIGKPDPAGYIITMNQIAEKSHQSLTPADCLIIEDSPSVIARARQAGFKVLAVTTSHPAEKLIADYILPSLDPKQIAQQIPTLKMTLG